MVPVHQLVPIIGAGGAECWRRCMGVLAQVRKNGGDLRQHNAQNHDLRRRSHPQNPTCAKNAAHLRQECCPPAPEKVLTCAGKAADLFHSGSSSCRFVLLMPLVLSTDDAFCHSGLDPESLSCPCGRTGPYVISTERSEWRNLFATFLLFFQKKFADMIFVCTFAVY